MGNRDVARQLINRQANEENIDWRYIDIFAEYEIKQLISYINIIDRTFLSQYENEVQASQSSNSDQSLSEKSDFIKLVETLELDVSALVELDNNYRADVLKDLMVQSLNHLVKLEKKNLNGKHERELKKLIDRVDQIRREKEMSDASLQAYMELAKISSSTRKLFAQMVGIAASIFVIYVCYRIVIWITHVVPDVSVDIDVGELVGGSLIGIGALFAGGAYAFKTLGGGNAEGGPGVGRRLSEVNERRL